MSHLFPISCRIRKQNKYKWNGCLKTNEGMTCINHTNKRKKNRVELKCMNSITNYSSFSWATVGSQACLNAIDGINDLYSKIPEIGKAIDVLYGIDCPNIVAKTNQEFQKYRDNTRRNYRNYQKTAKAKLAIFCVDTELLPHPYKYGRDRTRRFPTNREVIAKERILTCEHYIASLNVFKCSMSLACEI